MHNYSFLMEFKIIVDNFFIQFTFNMISQEKRRAICYMIFLAKSLFIEIDLAQVKWSIVKLIKKFAVELNINYPRYHFI